MAPARGSSTLSAAPLFLPGAALLLLEGAFEQELADVTGCQAEDQVVITMNGRPA
jgi:hypothetical protein